MGDAFITRHGGGVKEGFALIAVTYPAGALCTCTDGSKTLTAEGTGGKYLFAVPNAGTWTVTATDGSRTKSKSVSITERYQFADVTIGFEYVVFADGVLSPDVGNGVFVTGRSDWAYFNVGDQVVLSCDDYYESYDPGSSFTLWKFSTLIDLTEYSTMHITGSSGQEWGTISDGNASIGVGTGGSLAASAFVPATEQSFTVDVSALTGSYYLMLRTECLSYSQGGGGYIQRISYISFE